MCNDRNRGVKAEEERTKKRKEGKSGTKEKEERGKSLGSILSPVPLIK